mmetsp:Transcript_3600/g.7897  ORF Transcript_3600/g.7897 Transcript_3600/m.7897 type:complete len:104 (+) Transcript_3600:469-780(+)
MECSGDITGSDAVGLEGCVERNMLLLVLLVPQLLSLLPERELHGEEERMQVLALLPERELLGDVEGDDADVGEDAVKLCLRLCCLAMRTCTARGLSSPAAVKK